tara:strand:- start:137 stop:391 length:255 start_codon:yes stop_codon:yes gene_type:complete
MIALAITCLLIAAVFVALLSATDSMMRGWHSYGALAKELRALRAMPQEASGSLPAASTRSPAIRPAHRPARQSRRPATGLRAAA